MCNRRDSRARTLFPAATCPRHALTAGASAEEKSQNRGRGRPRPRGCRRAIACGRRALRLAEQKRSRGKATREEDPIHDRGRGTWTETSAASATNLLAQYALRTRVNPLTACVCSRPLPVNSGRDAELAQRGTTPS